MTRSPGISFTGSPGDGGTGLSARGFEGHSSVMTLFDGSRLYSGAGTLTFPVDPWMVERIDILRGPASVLYGEGATGAVVNVIPKNLSPATSTTGCAWATDPGTVNSSAWTAAAA